MRNLISLVVVVVLVVAGIGCEITTGKEKVNVTVNCETVAGPAVSCEVKQVAGKSEVDVCWDFAVSCPNGVKVVAARTCHKVKDGATDKVTIPGDKLTDVDKCTKAENAAVTNLTMNGKKPE